MISLFATFCALSAPCREVEFTFDANEVSLMTLMVCGQTELAKWTNEHPGYFVKKWSVGATGRYAKV